MIAFTTGSLAVDIQCRYHYETDWIFIDGVYHCDLNVNLTIPNPYTEITSVSGVHVDNNSNAQVVGFRAKEIIMHYLPHGSEKYFDAEKIIFMNIHATGLKEIHQIDLAPFTKMKFLSLWDNDLEVIESDLFKFNPKLECIALGYNKIKFIDGNVFGDLKHLQSLFLKYNDCISKEAVQDVFKVLYLTRMYQRNCTTANIQ